MTPVAVPSGRADPHGSRRAPPGADGAL